MNYKWCMAHIDELECIMYFAETREELEDNMLAMVKETMIEDGYCTEHKWTGIEAEMRSNMYVSNYGYELDMSDCCVFRVKVGWHECWHIREIK